MLPRPCVKTASNSHTCHLQVCFRCAGHTAQVCIPALGPGLLELSCAECTCLGLFCAEGTYPGQSRARHTCPGHTCSWACLLVLTEGLLCRHSCPGVSCVRTTVIGTPSWRAHVCGTPSWRAHGCGAHVQLSAFSLVR